MTTPEAIKANAIGMPHNIPASRTPRKIRVTVIFFPFE
jgi:hypothetical protein